MNPRQLLKRDLLEDPSRRIERNGQIYVCEGQAFKPHECAGGIHLNEVLITRGMIRHLTPKQKEYYWDKRNCALNCGMFHFRYGHSRAYREYWLKNTEGAQAFLNGADLKVRA